MSWPKVKECLYRGDVIGFLITWSDQRMTYHQAEAAELTISGGLEGYLHAKGTRLYFGKVECDLVESW